MKDVYEGCKGCECNDYEAYKKIEEVDEIAITMMALLMRDDVNFEFCSDESDAENRKFLVLSANPVEVTVKKGEAHFFWKSDLITSPALIDYYTEAIAYDWLDETALCRTFLERVEEGCYLEAEHTLHSREVGEEFACTAAYNLFLFQAAVNGIVREMEEIEEDD